MEGCRVELPVVVQLERRCQLAGVLQVCGMRPKPVEDVCAFAPGSQRAEADEPDQRPVRVLEKAVTDAVDRQCPVQIQFTRELSHGQRGDLARSRREGRGSHGDVRTLTSGPVLRSREVRRRTPRLGCDPRFQFGQINAERAFQPRAHEIRRAVLPIGQHALDLRLWAVATGALMLRRALRELLIQHDPPPVLKGTERLD